MNKANDLTNKVNEVSQVSQSKFYTILDDLGNYCDKNTVHKCPISKKWTYMVRDQIYKELYGEKGWIYSGGRVKEVLEKLRKNIHKVESEHIERTFKIVEVEI